MSSDNKLHFPSGFVWGTATASYQIEGAWNEEGKSLSIWDAFAHTDGKVKDGSTGDVACDSYHRYHDDIAALKQLGVSSYRLSIAWTRIIPDPRTGEVNPKGVAYYNDVIDSCLKEGITPLVTLYHWDLPLVLQEELGGWSSDAIIPHFLRYAEVCFEAFGDRVKKWATFNEPWVFINLGYVLEYHAPGRKDMAEDGPYACVHNFIRAHAQTYRLYEKKFKPVQNGQVGVVLSSDWSEPRNPDNHEDVAAASRHMLFHLGLFAHPIFVDGDYPSEIKTRLATRCSPGACRLPEFSEEEKAYIKGSADFFGLNYYTSRYTESANADTDPGYHGDQNFKDAPDAQWTRGQSEWLYSVPWGLRKLLNYVKVSYGAPVIYITENGFSDSPGNLHDTGRINYLRDHLREVHAAITEDGVDVRGYFCWTLIDNFEWAAGYTERFGLFCVDFDDPARQRSPKDSVAFYRTVVTTNSV